MYKIFTFLFYVKKKENHIKRSTMFIFFVSLLQLSSSSTFEVSARHFDKDHYCSHRLPVFLTFPCFMPFPSPPSWFPLSYFSLCHLHTETHPSQFLHVLHFFMIVTITKLLICKGN